MQEEVVVPALPDDYQLDSSASGGAQIQYVNDSLPVAATPSNSVSSGMSSATGQPISSQGPLISTDTLGNFTLMGLIEVLIAYAFIIAAALAAVFIFIGGISFILSGGNDEKIKQAINTIRYSIIGLIVTLLSFTFVIIVGRIFGLDFMQYLSFEKVRNDISRIVAPASTNSSNFEVQQ